MKRKSRPLLYVVAVSAMLIPAAPAAGASRVAVKVFDVSVVVGQPYTLVAKSVVGATCRLGSKARVANSTGRVYWTGLTAPSTAGPRSVVVKCVVGTRSGSGTGTVTVLPAPVFRNCTAMRVTYPHGVGRPGAVDQTSGTPVTTFLRSREIYAANRRLDADQDLIACERL